MLVGVVADGTTSLLDQARFAFGCLARPVYQQLLTQSNIVLVSSGQAWVVDLILSWERSSMMCMHSLIVLRKSMLLGTISELHPLCALFPSHKFPCPELLNDLGCWDVS